MKISPSVLREAALLLDKDVATLFGIEEPDILDAIAAVYYRFTIGRLNVERDMKGPLLQSSDFGGIRWEAVVAQYRLMQEYIKALQSPDVTDETLKLLHLIFRAIFIHQMMDAGNKSPIRMWIEMLFRKRVEEPGLYSRMLLVRGSQARSTVRRDKWIEIVNSRLRLMRSPDYGRPGDWIEEVLGGWWKRSRATKVAIRRYERFTPEDFEGVASFSDLWSRFGFRRSEADEPLKRELLDAWLTILYGANATKASTIDAHLESIYRNWVEANGGDVHFSLGSPIDDLVEKLQLPLPTT